MTIVSPQKQLQRGATVKAKPDQVCSQNMSCPPAVVQLCALMRQGEWGPCAACILCHKLHEDVPREAPEVRCPSQAQG